MRSIGNIDRSSIYLKEILCGRSWKFFKRKWLESRLETIIIVFLAQYTFGSNQKMGRHSSNQIILERILLLSLLLLSSYVVSSSLYVCILCGKYFHSWINNIYGWTRHAEGPFPTLNISSLIDIATFPAVLLMTNSTHSSGSKRQMS